VRDWNYGSLSGGHLTTEDELILEGTLPLPEQQFTYDVFISYSHKDKQWVQLELLPWLKRAGLRICIDSESYGPREPFEVGTPIDRAVEQAIETSRKILCVFSPAYRDSAWCELEQSITTASDPAARRRRLVPILLQHCSLPAGIGRLLYADFTQAGSHKQAWDKLLVAVGKQTMPKTTKPRRPHTSGIPPWYYKSGSGIAGYVAFWSGLRTVFPEIFTPSLSPWIFGMALLVPLVICVGLLFLRRRTSASHEWDDWDRVLGAWSAISFLGLLLALMSFRHLWPPPPTATPIPTHTSSKTPAKTTTPTVTPTPKPSTTATATATSEPAATATVTPVTAPVLESPTNEASLGGGRITFQWRWDRELRADEYFDVRIWKEGQPALGIAWVKDPVYDTAAWNEAGWLGEGKFYWDIVVLRHTGTTSNGEKQWEAVSTESQVRWFSRGLTHYREDVNGDCWITKADADQCTTCYTELQTPASKCPECDIDGNGFVDISDISAILSKYTSDKVPACY